MVLRVFLDLMWYFKQEKRKYLFGIALLMAHSLLNLLPPRMVGTVVDGIRLGHLTAPALAKWLAVILGVGLGTYALSYVWRLMLFGSSINLSRLLRNQLYNHFTKMSPQFFHNRRVGDLMAHATNDVSAIESTAGEGILTLVDSITTGTIVTLSMAITINWKLTLITLIPMPFMAWATRHYGSLLHQRFGKAQAAFSDLNDKVQENISGVRVIKAFGQEEVEKRDFAKLSAEVVDKNVSVAKVDALFDPTISLIVGVSFFLAVSVGSIFVVRGTLTLGQLTTFTMYLGQLIWPMLAFGWLFNIVERGRASHDRVRELLAVQPDIVDKSGALDRVPSGDIEFRVTRFTYPGVQTPALRNVNVGIRRGTTLGIVGKTGSGKTTFLKLLMREFDCTDGEIIMGNTSIYDVKLEKLRSAVAYVPQDHFLFSATISENIAFAKPNATMAEIKNAAKVAAIHEDIERFEDKYGTIVGERGVTLSGGQKQRISIARAVLLDAEVLILDDSLSAVDAKTEAHILEDLRQNRQNRTTLIAAHRLSAIEHAELIIVIDDGNIIERGNHETLMMLDGWYASMYQRQQLEEMVEQGGVNS
jgi:ATP-binding cassette, subfamily B, multidrug efflux pump